VKKLSKKLIVALACVFLVACVAVGSTVAYLLTKAPPLENPFTPVYLTCETEGSVKTGVTVKYTGDTDGYIRATLVCNWVSETDDAVHATAPKEGVDYTATWNTDTWFQGADGFYYYKTQVRAGEATDALVSNFVRVSEPPQGYKLTVQVLASAVQSQPAQAVQSVWSVTVLPDGTLSA